MTVRSLLLTLTAIAFLQHVALGQDIKSLAPSEEVAASLNPTDTVKEFYRLLREKRYVEGFRLSVYQAAIEGLSKEELEELQPDFDNAFTRIPANLRVLGSQINSQNATVFIKSSDDPKDLTAEEVSLIKIDDVWKIGDLETLKLVKELERRFFPEVRIRVNEDTAQQYMERYIGAEKLYSDANKGAYGSMDDLVRAQFWPPSLKSGEIYGYKFAIELNSDKRSVWIHAEPAIYNKTGRASFYGDVNGVYKFDNGGKVYKVQLNSDKN